MTDAYYCANGQGIMLKHRHYRMVLGTVGYDLQRLRGTDELLRATYDVFQGKYTLNPGSLALIERTTSHTRRIHTGQTSSQRRERRKHHSRGRW